MADLANTVVAATTAGFVFAFIAVALRLYARIALVKKLYGEDYILTSSFLVAMSWWVVKVIGATRSDNNSAHLLAMITWYGTIAWGLSSALTKLSIVYQYWRIFEDIRWVRILCNYLMGFLVLYGAYSFFGAIFECTPVSAAWSTVSDHKEQCVDPRIYYYLTGSVNIFADVVIFALPIKPVLDLRIPMRQRMALLFCFTFGALVIICSVVRLYWLVQQMNTQVSRDIVERATIWAGIEMMTSIIGTCFPVLRPLAMRWFPKLLGSSIGSAAKSRISRYTHRRKTHAGVQQQQQPQQGQDQGQPQMEYIPGGQVPKHIEESSGSETYSEGRQTFELDSRQTPGMTPGSEGMRSPEGLQQNGWNSSPYTNYQQQQSQQPQQQQQQQQQQEHQHQHQPIPYSHFSTSTDVSMGTRSLTSSAAPAHASHFTSATMNLYYDPSGRNSTAITNHHNAMARSNSTGSRAAEQYMPVSPQSTYQGSFRTSTVSALSHYPSIGPRGSVRGSLHSSFNGRNVSLSAVSGPNSSTSTPNLNHMYYAGGSAAGGGNYRASGSSSVYSRYSGATVNGGGGSVSGSGRGLRGRLSSSTSLNSFGTSSFGTSTVTSGGGSAMNTIVDREEEDDDEYDYSHTGNGSRLGGQTQSQQHGMSAGATGVEDISAQLETAITTLQERSRSRGTFIEPARQSGSGLEVYYHEHHKAEDNEEEEEEDDGDDDDDDYNDETFVCATAAVATPWHKRTPSSSKEVLAVQYQPASPARPQLSVTTTQPQPQAELEGDVGAELPASSSVSPFKPMAKPVLPPLFFEPEHSDYNNYRLSMSHPNSPSFLPPRRGLPAVPGAGSSSSSRNSRLVTNVIGELDGADGRRKKRKSAFSPLGLFEMSG